MRPILIALALVPLGACQQQVASPPVSKAPAIEVVGPAVDCITTTQIRNTRVHDDYTIDFEMTNGRTYRNTLPNRCPSLGFEERFSDAPTGNRLCSVDIIHVIYSNGAIGAGCGLGPFLPVKISKPEKD